MIAQRQIVIYKMTLCVTDNDFEQPYDPIITFTLDNSQILLLKVLGYEGLDCKLT